MDLIQKLKLNMAEATTKDIEAWIKIAEGSGITDKIASLEFSRGFKSRKEYADFLRLLLKQQKEKIALMKKHFKAQDDFKKRR